MRATPSWTPAKQRRRHVIPFSQQTNKANTTFRHHPDTIQTPFRHHPDIIQLLSFIHVCSRCPCKIVFWTKLFEINLIVLTWMQNLPYLFRWHRFSLVIWSKPSNTKRNCTTNAKSVFFPMTKSYAMIANRRKTSFRHHSDMLQVSFRYLSDHSPQLCAAGLQHFMLPKFSCDLVFMNSKCLPIWPFASAFLRTASA